MPGGWTAIQRAANTLVARPTCATCQAIMILARVAPIPQSNPMKVERTFECACGAAVTIPEAPAAT